MKTPSTVAEVADIIRSSKRVLAVGAQTKPRLSQVPDEVTLISMRNLSGIVEYDPGEFTFTAVRFLDGNGTQLRGGAKVVKNAAGFDIPKFLVGSLGRFGVLTEVTFKVFPCPPALMTFEIPCANAAEAAAHIAKAASGRWEFDALDYDGTRILARLRGPQEALDLLAADILNCWPAAKRADNAVWDGIREWRFVGADGLLVKIPVTLRKLPALEAILQARNMALHVVGGSVAYAYHSNVSYSETLNEALVEVSLGGLTLRGFGARLCHGDSHHSAVAQSLKLAFDPCHRLGA